MQLASSPLPRERENGVDDGCSGHHPDCICGRQHGHGLWSSAADSAAVSFFDRASGSFKVALLNLARDLGLKVFSFVCVCVFWNGWYRWPVSCAAACACIRESKRECDDMSLVICWPSLSRDITGRRQFLRASPNPTFVHVFESISVRTKLAPLPQPFRSEM